MSCLCLSDAFYDRPMNNRLSSNFHRQKRSWTCLTVSQPSTDTCLLPTSNLTGFSPASKFTQLGQSARCWVNCDWSITTILWSDSSNRGSEYPGTVSLSWPERASWGVWNTLTSRSISSRLRTFLTKGPNQRVQPWTLKVASLEIAPTTLSAPDESECLHNMRFEYAWILI